MCDERMAPELFLCPMVSKAVSVCAGAAVLQGTQARLRLKDAEMRHLMVEVPAGLELCALDDVTARARF